MNPPILSVGKGCQNRKPETPRPCPPELDYSKARCRYRLSRPVIGILVHIFYLELQFNQDWVVM